MDRKLISHRIGSILDDISRLSNALYALDTTDIQRYCDVDFYVRMFGHSYPTITQRVELTGYHNTKF